MHQLKVRNPTIPRFPYHIPYTLTCNVQDALTVVPARNGAGSTCAALSVAAVLGWAAEDRTEGAFEVALFAEAFAEMLAARFGRVILRSLTAMEQRVCTRAGSRV